MTPSPRLRRGDPVAVVAPAGPFDRESFDRGLAQLAARYRPVHDPGIFATDRYLAGPDERRLGELNGALGDAETRAVFCARGGYGAMRLLQQLRIPPAAKPLVGFSDVTALHAAFQLQGRISIHGPVVTQLGRLSEDQVEHLFALLEDPGFRPVLRGRPFPDSERASTTAAPVVVEGPVVGGNLSVLTRLLGTPFMPPLDGAILFLEDVGERPYRLDRMWQHLTLAGVFSRVAGIALGEFTGCDETGATPYTAADVLRECVSRAGLPCVADLPIGHGAHNFAFPLGARAQLDAASGTLSFLEGAVR